MVQAQLFITCLGEQFFSPVLKDMVRVLERLGVQCALPNGQTCCGQPFYNSGLQMQGRALAHRWMRAFGETDGYIVSLSGSCVEFVKHRYPDMFPEGSPEHALAVALAARTFEFSQFLVHVLKTTDVGAAFPHKVAYHASCHLTRGLGVREEPLQLVHGISGIDLVPLKEADTCCGFGGIFSVVYPEVSRAMMQAKVDNIAASGADVVIVNEPGCLMNIAGGLQKIHSPVRAMHLVQLLASSGGGR